MGSKHASEFWQCADSDRQRLVETFESHVTLDHPNSITGRSVGCGFCYHCGWCATAVCYPSYDGPDIDNY